MMLKLEEFETLLALRPARAGEATREEPATSADDQRPRDDRWAEVERVLLRHWHDPDLSGARALYSAVAAHDLAGQPVWSMAVAPPSSMKTEVIRALDGLPRVHSIDGVTAKTFISGQIRDKDNNNSVSPLPSSLLHRIGENGILLCLDFSTILAIKADNRNMILADLRRIYDGELRKEYGTSDVVPGWKGRITVVAAVTEDIDKHYSVIQSLGDRFVMVRWVRAGEEAAIRAMAQDLMRARADLRRAVHELFASLPAEEPHVPDWLIRKLAALAEFAARARSHIPREGPDKAIVGEPQAESAPRLAQQLCQLVKGSARLAHRTTATKRDFLVARRVAFDCIRARRRTMLERAIKGKISVNTSTKTYDRQDLEVLELVSGEHLSQLAKDLLDTIDSWRDEFEEFTESPPNASDQINGPNEVGGTSGEEVPEGGVL